MKGERVYLAQIEMAMEMREGLKGLTKQESAALRLRAHYLFSYEHIARELNITRPRARVLVLRAVDRLRKLAAANDERL